MRSHFTSALNDQAATQQLLSKNLEDQLAQLTIKENDLLDLATEHGWKAMSEGEEEVARGNGLQGK